MAAEALVQIGNLLSGFLEERGSQNRGISDTVVEVLKWLLLGFFLLMLAIVLYGFLYLLLIPSMGHYYPLYFDYSGARANSSDPKFISKPVARIDMLQYRTQWDASDLLDTPSTPQRILEPNTYYDAWITLELSESLHNEDMGVFLVTTEFLTEDMQLLATATRPAIVRYRSPYLRLFRVLSFNMMYFLNLFEEKQTLRFRTIDNYVDPVDTPLAIVRVSLSSDKVELYSASLSLETRLTGLKYAMYHWFFTSAFIGVLQIFGLELVMVITGYLLFTQTESTESNSAQPDRIDATHRGNTRTEPNIMSSTPADRQDDDMGIRKRK